MQFCNFRLLNEGFVCPKGKSIWKKGTKGYALVFIICIYVLNKWVARVALNVPFQNTKGKIIFLKTFQMK